MEEYDYMYELETEIDSYKLRISKLLEEKETLIQEIDELKEFYDSNIWWQNRCDSLINKNMKLNETLQKINEYVNYQLINTLNGENNKQAKKICYAIRNLINEEYEDEQN